MAPIPLTSTRNSSNFKNSNFIIDLTGDTDSEENNLLPTSHDGLLVSSAFPPPPPPPAILPPSTIRSQRSRPSPPILPGATVTNRHTCDARPQAQTNQLETQSESSRKRRKISQSNEHRRETPILPPPRVFKSKAAQPKPENSTHNSQKDFSSSGGITETFSEVLHSQVFIHITNAMEDHKRSIDEAKLRVIGARVAGELVTNSMFEDLNRYGGQLSKKDEGIISRRARAYVNNFVEQSLALPGLQTGQSPKDVEESDEASPIPAPSTLDSPAPLADTQASSPTTSFGTDVIDDSLNISRVRRNKHTVRNEVYGSVPGSRRATRSQTPTAHSGQSHFNGTRLLPQNGIRATSRATRRKKYGETSPIESLMESLQGENMDVGQSLISNNDTAAASTIEIRSSKPYLVSASRYSIRQGLQRVPVEGLRDIQLWDRVERALNGAVYHIDFCTQELSIVRQLLASQLPHSRAEFSITALVRKQKLKISELSKWMLTQLQPGDINADLIKERGPSSLASFLQDAAAEKLSDSPRTLRINLGPRRLPRAQISTILRQREMHGMVPVRSRVGQRSYTRELYCMLEDSLRRKTQWTNCCGDIWAIAWTGTDTFVCGATAHSDTYNMQYNKPGNLVFGSVSKETLVAVPDHRIARPIVNKNENFENALDSMRQTQDPWLYTSISAISHNHTSGYTFTASFDGTVKIWKVSGSDKASVKGTWKHEGKVNFVVTSEHHDLIATAADVFNNAVRVYQFDKHNVQQSPFHTLNSERSAEQAQAMRKIDTWEYFPATIQWGKAEDVSHLLLVGYSPRSLSGEDSEIPEDKVNSGEICLFDALDGSRVPIGSARTQNVFELIWHPTQPAFIAATSPCGMFETETKTQIRLFARNDTGTFVPVRVLDCPACDINELTIMPNSLYQCYITASCTDGNTYVWDTGAAGDGAIHVLSHGESLDNPVHDLPREIADTGVKFAQWGKSADRFYTGGSDGKVYAWDIQKAPGKALVREVLAASGGISAGAFNTDFSMLLIGDATGKIHVLTREDDDEDSEDEWGCPKRVPPKSCSRPKAISQHPEPDPPEDYEPQGPKTGVEIAKALLDEGFIAIDPDPAIGAVQGPSYAELGLYRYEAHEQENGSRPLLPDYQARQQRDLHINMGSESQPSLPVIKYGTDLATHLRNLTLDLDFQTLEIETKRSFSRERVEVVGEFTFEYEPRPHHSLFRRFTNGGRGKTRNDQI